MSLVGFRARNHPQQVAKGGAKLAVDDMATAPELFDPLNERFGGFTLDAAASSSNAKCERYYTLEDDGLAQDWSGERVWCNPPYSDLLRWVRNAALEYELGSVDLIVMLVPANRTEQRWWQEWVEPWRDGRRGNGPRVEFLAGRPRFIRYEDGVVRPNERPPFGVCLLIWGKP